jgi:uncharacterized membrane protein YhhN
MVLSIPIVLMVAALVCFVVAALSVTSPRFNFVAGGLALWVLAQILVSHA